jgi:hypothetical protein
VPTLLVRRPSQLIVTALAALVVACTETPRASPSDSAPPSDFGGRTPAPTDSAFVFRVRAELAALDTAIALGDWRAKHPGDSVALFSHRLQDYTHDKWCARATLGDTAGVTAFVRHAYFYPPTPPPGLEVPAASEPLAPNCRLGAIWVESPLPGDGGRGISGEDLIAGLRRWYGPDAPIGRLHFSGRASWNPVAQWRSGGVTVVAALARQSVWSEEAPRFLAIAFAPPSTLGYGLRENLFAYTRFFSMSTLVERAMPLVRAGPAESAPLLQLLREGMLETRRDSAEWMAWKARGMSVLRDWVTSAHARDTTERAAALLVADIALSMPGLRLVVPNDSIARHVLGALGAEFDYSSIGEAWFYTHSWQRTAQALTPSGPVADLALLIQLERGFDDKGMCSAGAEEFRRVIAEGEPFLSRLQESSDRIALHYLLGTAYADIVALADSVTDYAEPERYRAEAAAARDRSLEHLRQALTLDPRAPNALHAWVTAWRLQAGLPPLSVRFFCMYD